MKKLIKSKDAFKSPIRRSKVKRIRDLRKNEFNHIVCADTKEVCKSYKSYLVSKHWKLFKKRYKESKHYIGHCLFCSSSVRLHFHHITYVRLGKENLEDVIPLCKLHHVQVHRALRKGAIWTNIMTQLEESLL